MKATRRVVPGGSKFNRGSSLVQRFRTVLFLLVSLSLLSGCAQSSPAAQAPVSEPAGWPTTGWPTSTPEQQGMRSEQLIQMFQAIEDRHLNLHSVLIVRNGYLVLEAYYHPYGPADVHTIESNTKSVIGTLVGMAIDQGKIENVDQRMLDFFPHRMVKQLDARKEAITLHHLLSLTPGLDCGDWTPGGQGMYSVPHWVQYLLDLPMNASPGEQWVYCSGAAHLLSAILQEATGLDARTYANQHLFQPLGIPEVPEADWAPDPHGVTNGIAGLYLTPRDLAKLGYLYLQKGQWEGVQVVSEAWIEAATQEQAYIGPDAYVGGLDRRFGYLFSIFPKQEMYGYLGRAGQELYVVPQQNLVVVFTAGLEVGKEASLLALVNDFIVPAMQSQAPLPANPGAQEELEARIRRAAGKAQPIPALPQTALDISGVTYVMDPNTMGWQKVALLFEPGSSEATLRMPNNPDLAIGLDGRYRLTPVPGSRPLGLRGRWTEDGRFYLENIYLGEFGQIEGWFQFEGDQITLSVHDLNLPGHPVVLRGARQP